MESGTFFGSHEECREFEKNFKDGRLRWCKGTDNLRAVTWVKGYTESPPNPPVGYVHCYICPK